MRVQYLCEPEMGPEVRVENDGGKPLNRNHDHGRFSHATTAGQGSARTIKAHRTPLAPPRTILMSH